MRFLIAPWKIENRWDRLLQWWSYAAFVFCLAAIFLDVLHPFVMWLLWPYIIATLTRLVWTTRPQQFREARQLERKTREASRDLTLIAKAIDEAEDDGTPWVEKLPPHLQEEVRIRRAREVLKDQ